MALKPTDKTSQSFNASAKPAVGEKIYLLYNTAEANRGLANTAAIQRGGVEVDVPYTKLMRFKDEKELNWWKKKNPGNAIAWAGVEKDCKFKDKGSEITPKNPSGPRGTL